jgi:hypothetical protein
MRLFVIAGFIFGPIAALHAQQVAVQQPVVATNSVRTTVSVPDRGSALLGGVNSAQSGRSSYGPLRSGTSTGLSRSASSMSTSVYIHDLRAMDEALLNSIPDSPAPSALRGNSRATRSEGTAVEAISPTERVANFERLARSAEEAAKPSLAKMYWQMAAKCGSKIADEKLGVAPLKRPTTSQTAAKD